VPVPEPAASAAPPSLARPAEVPPASHDEPRDTEAELLDAADAAPARH
jgi:hypothetical protein